MPSVTASAVIPAPPERVWELISDTSRYAEWVHGTDEVTRNEGRAREGSTYAEANTLLGPWKAKTSWTVIEFAPPRRQVHTSADVPLNKRFDVIMELEPEGDATLFTCRLEVEPALGPLGLALSKLLTPVANRENRKTVQNLAGLFE